MNEDNNQSNTQKKGITTLIPSLAAALGAVLTIVAFFLPFVSATSEHREYLNAISSSEAFSDDFGVGNASDLSMLDFFKLYSSGEAGDNGVIYVGFIVILATFTLLSLVAALVRKPIFAMVTAALTFAVFLILSWDFTDRGLVGNSYYDWGSAKYFYYIGFIVLIGCSIWLLIEKKKAKRMNP